MNLFTAAFSKIFKNGNQQVLDKIKPLLQKSQKLSMKKKKLQIKLQLSQ